MQVDALVRGGATLGSGNNSKSQHLQTAEVYFSLVLHVYHELAGGSALRHCPHCRTQAHKSLFMLSHLLRQERIWQITHWPLQASAQK